MKKFIGRLPLLALFVSVLMSGFFVFNNSYAEELEVAPELPPVDSPVGELSPEISVPPEEPNPPADGSALEEILLPAEEQESEPETSAQEDVVSPEESEEPEVPVGEPELPVEEDEEPADEQEENSEPELLPSPSSVIVSEWTIVDGTKFVTSAPVVVGKTYVAPTNDAVTVTFTRLPEIPGTLTIEEITISEELAAAIGSASTTLYDITSDMEDGTFEYTLTLPAPAEVQKATIEAAESVETAEASETVAEEVIPVNNVITVQGLNHFTVFIIVDDGDVNHSDCTDAWDCFWLFSDKDWSNHNTGYNGDHKYVEKKSANFGATSIWKFGEINREGDEYAILLSWVVWNDHATNAKYWLTSDESVIAETNQKKMADGTDAVNGTWSDWYAAPGKYTLNRNSIVGLTLLPSTNGNLSADAVAFVNLSEAEFINSPKTVEAYDASQLVAEFKAPNLASAGRFTINGETVVATSSEAGPDSDFFTFKLLKSLPVGTYSVTAEYKLGTAWYPVNGEGSVTASDTIGPAAPSIVSPLSEQYFKSQPIRNEWTAATDPSGIKEYRIEYVYDDGHSFADAPYRTTTGTWRNHVPAVNEQGGVKFRVQAMDNAGNYGAWSEWAHYYYDATKPVVEILNPTVGGSFQLNPLSVRATDNLRLKNVIVHVYNSANQLIDFSCDKNVSSLDVNDYTVSCSVTGLPDGTYSVRTNAYDMAGNMSETLNRGFIIDRTAPTVIITAPTGSLYNTDVEVRGTVEDANPHHYWIHITRNGADVVNKTVNGGNITDKLLYTAKEEGNYVITLAARDAVGGTPSSGNRSADVVRSFTIDKTAPSAPALISPANGSFIKGVSVTNSWESSDADVSHFIYESYHDAAALNLRWNQTINAPATSKTASGVAEAVFWWRVKAVDKAGNVGPWSELWKVTVDNTAPVIYLNGSGETASVYLDGEWDDPVSASDALEGDLTSKIVITGTVDTSTLGEYWLSYDVADSAGNAAEQKTRKVNVMNAPRLNNGPQLNDGSSGNQGNQGSQEGQGGEIAGAETFRFTKDLWFGMKDSDVTELQKALNGEGLLEIEGFTDFFGTLTFKAVKGYQEKYGIPVTGYVGPMTRAQLNGEEVEGAEIDKKGIQEQINNLMKKLAELMALFGKK